MNQALLRHFKIILSGLWSNHLLFGLRLSVFVCVLWVWIVCQLTTCACQCYWLPALLVLRLLTYVVRHLVPVTSNFFPFIVTCVSLSVVRLLLSVPIAPIILLLKCTHRVMSCLQAPVLVAVNFSLLLHELSAKRSTPVLLIILVSAVE